MIESIQALLNNKTRTHMQLMLASFAASLVICCSQRTAIADDHIILVVGAGGEAVYAEQFSTSAEHWSKLSEEPGFQVTQIGPNQSASSEQQADNDKQRLLAAIDSVTNEISTEDRLWIVMLGHGTFQQGIAKFNLEGPDISADELSTALKQVQSPLVLIHAFSSSGPWLEKLSGPGRVILTATRSGDEMNYSRFGNFLSQAISNADADLDHDFNISILEAFLKASAETSNFYQAEGRLQTEHALLDDNGDKVGTPPNFFRGVRVAQKAAGDVQPDGNLARRTLVLTNADQKQLTEEQQQQVTQLELEIATLRAKKSEMEEDQYFEALEPLLIKLAKIELQPK